MLFKGVDVFMDFDEAETYQVNVTLIENLDHLKFQQANEPYTDTRLTKLVLEEVDIRYAARPTFDETTRDNPDEKPGISIKNIKL
jgi:hypothetical protein